MILRQMAIKTFGVIFNALLQYKRRMKFSYKKRSKILIS